MNPYCWGHIDYNVSPEFCQVGKEKKMDITLILSIGIMILFALALSLRHIFGQGEVCKPGCSNIGLFTSFSDCPVCGGNSKKDLTKQAK